MTNQMLEIKRIKKVDENFTLQFSSLMDEETFWDVEQGEKFLANDDNALFVAYWDGLVAGFLSAHRLQRFDKRKAEVLIYEVSVGEEFRQRGIGKALINKSKEWAKEIGADEVWVLTYSSNIPAMAMYKSAGGEEDEPGTRMFTFKV
jgi:ribosomal protein S18 acetylase RimI-like enzyme